MFYCNIDAFLEELSVKDQEDVPFTTNQNSNSDSDGDLLQNAQKAGKPEADLLEK